MWKFIIGLFVAQGAVAQQSMPSVTPKSPAKTEAKADAKSDVKQTDSRRDSKIEFPPVEAVDLKAQEPKTADLLSALDYPELQVVPRASERLSMEAQLESERGWLAFWPLNLSALATLGTGYSLSGDYKDGATDEEKDDLDFRTQFATGVGVGWVALSTYYVFTRPYGTELKKVKAVGGRDRRSDLLRERLAEEALERPARLVRIFTWLALITNLGANAALLDQSTAKNNVYAVIGVLASALPFMFKNRYAENYEKHQEYKRKIYAPVAYLGMRQDVATHKYEPQLNLSWSF